MNTIELSTKGNAMVASKKYFTKMKTFPPQFTTFKAGAGEEGETGGSLGWITVNGRIIQNVGGPVLDESFFSPDDPVERVRIRIRKRN